jgi:predicted phosphodiesterase
VRFYAVSDLHLEFGPFSIDPPRADVVVLAGDIGLGTRGVVWARTQFPDTPIIYVPGNHEHYGEALPRLTEKLIAFGRERDVIVLDRDVAEVNGIRFFGATLWTDFALLGDVDAGMAAARQSVTDYRRIRVSPSFRRLRPVDTASLHGRARRWLDNEVAQGNVRGGVVVSHHAPSVRSLRPEFVDDPVSASYASALDDLVERSEARLWIHGHTHYCVDYQVGATRVFSNQRGYIDEPVEGFDPHQVLEL